MPALGDDSPVLTTHKSRQTDASQSVRELTSQDREQLNDQQSTAARRILDEARLAERDDSLEDWQSRAQQMVLKNIFLSLLYK